jgi:hypothetical protein
MIKKLKYYVEKNKLLSSMVKYIYHRTISKNSDYKKNKRFLKNATEIMHKIDDIFNELDIHYWLEYGTLLGVIRDNSFIKHDYDVDLGLFLEDYSKDIEKVFNKHGFKKVRKFSIDKGEYGLEESYVFNDVAVDLFYFTRKDNQMYSHGFKNEEGKSWVQTVKDNGGLIVREIYFPYSGFKKQEFLGREYSVPYDSDAHLKAFYGEEYKEPNPNWDPYTMAENVITLNNKLGDYIVYE